MTADPKKNGGELATSEDEAEEEGEKKEDPRVALLRAKGSW